MCLDAVLILGVFALGVLNINLTKRSADDVKQQTAKISIGKGISRKWLANEE